MTKGTSHTFKILMTGGHLTPALAVGEYLNAHHPSAQIIFLGRKFSQEQQKQLSQEQQEVEKKKWLFVEFTAAKVDQSEWWQWPIKLFHFLQSCWAAHRIINTYQPNIFMSFGGYLAVPVALLCWVHRVPIITHEQTRAPGIANRFIARLATTVAVNFPETAKEFKNHKTVVTGNPLRSSLFSPKVTQPDWFFKPSSHKLPLLYITGGNQGSRTINQVIAQILPQLLKDWVIIHQCGSPTAFHHYQKELEQLKSQLSEAQRSRYITREWLSSTELAYIYHTAQLVVSRSGANTVTELAACQVPAILIPLPFAHRQEQLSNAQWLTQLGGATIIHQRDLTPQHLLSTITSLKSRLGSIKRHYQPSPLPSNADERLSQLIMAYAPHSPA